MKDVEIPGPMQRAMARGPIAVAEKRARIIKAESRAGVLAQVARRAVYLAQNPAALELPRCRWFEVAPSTHTTVLMLPSDFMTLAKSAGDYLRAKIPARRGNGVCGSDVVAVPPTVERLSRDGIAERFRPLLRYPQDRIAAVAAPTRGGYFQLRRSTRHPCFRPRPVAWRIGRVPSS